MLDLCLEYEQQYRKPEREVALANVQYDVMQSPQVDRAVPDPSIVQEFIQIFSKLNFFCNTLPFQSSQMVE
ncbi:MAG: hypothetical protein CMF59_09810 [Leptospiraceae bacterium]|nr:hypothetical protein [Leptospiraceae bacterium]